MGESGTAISASSVSPSLVRQVAPSMAVSVPVECRARVVGHVRRRYLRLVPDPSPSDDQKLPIKMLNDRILVNMGGPEGERRSTGGILIPATAQMGKRLTWAEVVAVGPNVRNMEPGDRVLFNPEDRYEVEVRGEEYIILRERDIHAVAADRLAEGSTGLYL